MKKTTLILFLLIGISFGFSQNYSSKKIEKKVAELVEKVSDTAYFDYENGEKFDKPKMEFWVNNNITGNIFSSDPNFSDNEMYSTFQQILTKGKLSDFKIMCQSSNPSIRVYGFLALAKSKEFELAEEIMTIEKNKSDKVYWNVSGCVVDSVSTSDVMKKMMERIKKYGS